MNENLNLVSILKNAPVGTELYSPLFGTITFVGFDLSSKSYPIIVEESGGSTCAFSVNGKYYAYKDGECLLFPSKDNRDWSTFSLFKPGDFVYRKLKTGNEWISIHKKEENGDVFNFVDYGKNGLRHCYLNGGDGNPLCSICDIAEQRRATPSERRTLIQEMLKRGHIFDEKTCTLVELRPGTFIKVKTGCTWYLIFKKVAKNSTGGYIHSYVDFTSFESCLRMYQANHDRCSIENVTSIQLVTPEEEELCMECLKKHELIWDKETLSLTSLFKEEATFEPFQQVLVRDFPDRPWRIEFFSHKLNDAYYCLHGSWKYCIPFEGNKDKLGKI